MKGYIYMKNIQFVLVALFAAQVCQATTAPVLFGPFAPSRIMFANFQHRPAANTGNPAATGTGENPEVAKIQEQVAKEMPKQEVPSADASVQTETPKQEATNTAESAQTNQEQASTSGSGGGGNRPFYGIAGLLAGGVLAEYVYYDSDVDIIYDVPVVVQDLSATTSTPVIENPTIVIEPQSNIAAVAPEVVNNQPANIPAAKPVTTSSFVARHPYATATAAAATIAAAVYGLFYGKAEIVASVDQANADEDADDVELALRRKNQ